MIILYNLLLIILSVLLIPVIIVAFLIQPKFRAGFFQKFGFYGNASEKSTVVFHAVSVGEVNAVKELIKEFVKQNPEKRVIVTTTTKTGQELAKKIFNDIVFDVVYFPYDYFFSVLSFLNKYKPEKIIIAETEIWPSFITLSKFKNIKVYTVNGRISPNSYKGYKKLKIFLSPILNKYEKILMQTKEDVNRMLDIGAPVSKVEVMGNLKFDISANLSEEDKNKFREELKTYNYRIFIAASTHKGEDKIVLDVFKELKKKYNDAKLLIAPRHPQRYDEVGELINGYSLKWARRSDKADFENNEIIMLDTMGELSKLFFVCHIAFIGGSFSTTGGHNPLEANIWSKPVISGPCIYNFKDVYKIVTDKKCAVIVNNFDEFLEEAVSFYENQEKYNLFSSNANTVFEENKGAINYVLNSIN